MLHTGQPLRLCLDLNIWVADLLALHAGRSGSAAQLLVDCVRRGHSPLGPVQLVISWGMLNRLEDVLTRVLQVDRPLAQHYTAMIARYAAEGPASHAPNLSLGGTGLIALRDTEDAHVLDTARAGRANLLVTRNFGDFIPGDTRVRVPGEVATVRDPAGHTVIIAQPGQVLRWFAQGTIPSSVERRGE